MYMYFHCNIKHSYFAIPYLVHLLFLFCDLVLKAESDKNKVVTLTQ